MNPPCDVCCLFGKRREATERLKIKQVRVGLTEIKDVDICEWCYDHATNNIIDGHTDNFEGVESLKIYRNGRLYYSGA